MVYPRTKSVLCKYTILLVGKALHLVSLCLCMLLLTLASNQSSGSDAAGFSSEEKVT